MKPASGLPSRDFGAWRIADGSAVLRLPDGSEVEVPLDALRDAEAREVVVARALERRAIASGDVVALVELAGHVARGVRSWAVEGGALVLRAEDAAEVARLPLDVVRSAAALRRRLPWVTRNRDVTAEDLRRLCRLLDVPAPPWLDARPTARSAPTPEPRAPAPNAPAPPRDTDAERRARILGAISEWAASPRPAPRTYSNSNRRHRRGKGSSR